MQSHLQTLTKTAHTEWKIQVRQRTTWLLAGLFFLVGWSSVDHVKLDFLSASSIARSTAQGLGLFGTPFVVILGATSLLREFQPSRNFLWTRAFSTGDHIIGKYLGVCAGIGTAVLPVTVWVAYLEAKLYGLQGIVVQAKVWVVILAPTLLSILAMTLLIGLLLRRPLWTFLVMLFITVGILALNLDLTHLSGFAPYGIYLSPLIGYGPDSRLVGLHRAFYLELLGFCLLLGLLAAHFAVPRIEKGWNITRIAGWGLLALGMLAMMFYTATSFQDEVDLLSKDDSPAPQTRAFQNCSLFHDYRLELGLYFENAYMRGITNIQLQATETSLQIPLGLNAGFQISSIEITPPGIEAKVFADQLVLDLPQEHMGQDVSLTLKYAGALHIPRFLYDRSDFSPGKEFEPFWPGGYLDGETAFLTRDGNWHPFPGCIPNHIEAELVNAPARIIHTADKIESSAGHIRLIWEQQPPLPLLVISKGYREIQIGKATLFIAAGRLPASKLEEIISPYPVLLAEIDTYLQEEHRSDHQSFQIAEVPFLRYGYDPLSNVLFLDEFSPYDYLLPESYLSAAGPLHSQKLLYQRWVAEKMIRLWWCSDTICPPLQVSGHAIGYQEFSDRREKDKVVLNALLSYSALRLAEPLLGQEFVAAEIASRKHMLEDETLWTKLPLPLDSSRDINHLIVQLYQLWEKTGPEPFWRLVREYHRLYGTRSLPEDEFAQFVKQITGESLP